MHIFGLVFMLNMTNTIVIGGLRGGADLFLVWHDDGIKYPFASVRFYYQRFYYKNKTTEMQN